MFRPLFSLHRDWLKAERIMELSAKKSISIQVKVVTGASRVAFSGIEGDCYKIRLSEKPLKGRANKQLIHFLSDILDIPKSNIQILRGEKSKLKTIKISGLSPEEVQERFKS